MYRIGNVSTVVAMLVKKIEMSPVLDEPETPPIQEGTQAWTVAVKVESTHGCFGYAYGPNACKACNSKYLLKIPYGCTVLFEIGDVINPAAMKN
jgi:hypothetical protein